MSIFAVIDEALRALRLNRLRTALAMLGMIIGVAAVVLMLAVGQGAQSSVNQSIASMGSHLFIVFSGAVTTAGVRFGAGSAPTLTASDSQAIGSLPSVGAAAPVVREAAQLVYGNNNWNTQVYGVTPDFLKVREWALESGEAFSDTDVRAATRVVLLGQTVSKNLFGDNDPTGKTIRIKNSPFQVAGVLAAKGQSLEGRDQDDAALIPLSTAQRKVFGDQFPGSVRYIMAQARSSESMSEAEADMVQLLRTRHRLAEGMENDFTVRNLAAVAEAAAGTARVMSLMLGAIASISLLVGGIGIMNIMLVSVTERTREIGIRMAIGANRRDILLQFLLEALVICVLGGLIGTVLGVGGAFLFSQAADTIAVVTATSIGISFGFAAATGLFFGYYPARKAALMKPVEALRYE